jgi:hypothetical protein
MPIATCFAAKTVAAEKIEEIVTEWAGISGTAKKDICITLVPYHLQGGQQYDMLVNLYLPTLWSKTDVKKIQLGLLKTLCKHLELAEEKVFIMTSLIASGHVVENGAIVSW